MEQRQALYEKCFLAELENLFFYSTVLGSGKERILAMDTSETTDEERRIATRKCKLWANEKLVNRFHKKLFMEPVKISVRLDKGTNINTFQVESDDCKLIMIVNAKNNGFSVFLRSILKDAYYDEFVS